MGNDQLSGYADRERNARASRLVRCAVVALLVLTNVVPLLGLVAIDLTGSYRLLAPFLIAVPLLGLRNQAIIWSHYVRAFGLPPLGDLRQMLSIDRFRGYDPFKEDASSTDRGDVREIGPVFMALGGGVALVGALTGLLTPHFLALTMFVLGFKGLIRRARPPAVLLLTNSGVSADRLLGRLLQAIWPHLVASSLRHQTASPLFRQLSSFLSYRTANEDDWRHVVTSLMRVAPIVAIDTRTDTANIRFEIDHARDHVDPRRLLFVVEPGSGSPRDFVAGAACLTEGELIENLHRRLRTRHADPTPSVDARPNVYRDEENGYFRWEAPPGWRARRQQDARTKVAFTHPTLPEVVVSFIVRTAPGESHETLRETMHEDGEAAQAAAQLGIRTRVSPMVWNGMPAFRMYARSRDGMRMVQWRCISSNELSVNVQYAAPSLGLFRECWDQVQQAVSTIRVNAELSPGWTDDRTQQIDAYVRRARLLAETLGRGRAEEELQEGLGRYPGDPRLLSELDDLRRLGGPPS